VAATLEVSIASVKEAARSASLPDWWPSSILDAGVRRDVRMTALAREGSRAVASARLAVTSYDSLVSSERGLTRAGACKIDVLLLYLHNVTSVAKLKMLNRGVAFKGGGVKARGTSR
jgi:hypothetical protein